MRYIIFTFNFIAISTVFSFHLNVTKSFLKSNSLKECVILSCDNNANQNKEILKSIQDDNILVNVFDITSNNTNKLLNQLLYYRNYRIGVICNVKCLKFQHLFKIISTEKMFNFRYLWLFFGNTLNGIKPIMANYEINFDSEINLAIPEIENKLSLFIFLFYI